MIYKIIADVSSWPRVRNGGKPALYNDCAECIGSVQITFKNGLLTRSYENNYLNIPLFLTETSSFLTTTSRNGLGRWYLGFAPFAHGRIDGNNLLISSRSGKEFSKSIYDRMDSDELLALQRSITKDIAVYGSVETVDSAE